MDKKHSFLGKGWSFPPVFSKTGLGIQLGMAYGDQNIRESLRAIITTVPGERLMIPDYGADTSQLLFEDLAPSFVINLQDVISDAILFYEPRIKLDEVIVEMDQYSEGLVNISINYTIRETNTRSNFVFPYFLVEGTEIKRI